MEIKIAPVRAIQRSVYLYRISIYIYMHDYLQEIVILHIYAQFLEKQLHILGNPYFCAGMKWD